MSKTGWLCKNKFLVVDEQSLWLAFQRACHADHSLHMGRSISIEGDDIRMHSGQECAKGKLS